MRNIIFVLLLGMGLLGGNHMLQAQSKPCPLWGRSYLGQQLPKIEIKRWWQSKAPDLNTSTAVLLVFWTPETEEGQFLLKKLNEWQEAFSDELMVMAITNARSKLIKTKVPDTVAFYIGIDTPKRIQNKMKISALPYAILTNANREVIWEGYPFLNKRPLNKIVIKRHLGL